MRRRKPGPDRKPTRAEVEASLARKIRIWAQTWRRCPRKGCRRAGACLSFDRCAGVRAAPVTFSEAENRAFRRQLLEALRRKRGSSPEGGYDPEARERERSRLALIDDPPPVIPGERRTARGKGSQ